MENNLELIWTEIRSILKAHPWHGVHIGKHAPAIVTTFIEIVPTDTVKYEVDKESGYLKVDRPQKFSNVCPTPYGFIPQTYCDKHVAEICMKRTGKTNILGDGDPLDICVLTEKPITHNNILLKAAPIGGLRLIDGNEADDKIIAVMQGDDIFSNWNDISDCPDQLIDRLKHYFLTYKEKPGSTKQTCEIAEVYGSDDAYEIVEASYKDYEAKFGNMIKLLGDGKGAW